MITKTFEHKGQMINYFNKVKRNPNVGFCYCGYIYDDNGHGAYRVEYKYNK